VITVAVTTTAAPGTAFSNVVSVSAAVDADTANNTATDVIVVETAPTVTALSADPLTYGSTVLTAAVTSADGTPTGTVTFSEAEAPLGTAVLNSGTATLSLSTLSAGVHTLVARYQGDAEFSSSESNALTITVTAATPGVTIWPTASAITYGQKLEAATLSEGASSVDGTFAFAVPGSVPDAGTAAHNVIFTP
jgi:hypothetical protein